MDQGNAAEQAFLVQGLLEFLHKRCKLEANVGIIPLDYLKVDLLLQRHHKLST